MKLRYLQHLIVHYYYYYELIFLILTFRLNIIHIVATYMRFHPSCEFSFNANWPWTKLAAHFLKTKYRSRDTRRICIIFSK